MKIIDLRSDTVTTPSEGMRRAMYEAEVGDDVYREDPTVLKLERTVAEMFGKEAALFVPSGTMGNQICLNILTNPGDEVICESDAHIFHYESGTPAKLSGIQLYPVKGEKGVMYPQAAAECIRPLEAYYMPRTKVIALENTHNRAGGVVQPLGNIKELHNLAKEHNLYFHMDGARIWNASTASKISYKEYGKYFDTISVCLSKGLGAPVGTVIMGTKELMDKAFVVRKSIGGGMRQVGILAAAGLYALNHNLPILNEDHAKAKMLAEYLAKNNEFSINYDDVHTNMVVFKINDFEMKFFIEECSKLGLLLSEGKPGYVRAVTHLDVSFEEIEFAIKIINRVVNENQKKTKLENYMEISNYNFSITEEVKFRDIDLLGVCNNAVYFSYFEDARIGYLENLKNKFDVKTILEGDSFFIMANNNCDYIKPSIMHDELNIYTRIEFIKNSSFGFKHIVENKKTKEIIAKGSGIFVHISKKYHTSTPLPEEFYNAVKLFDPMVKIIQK